MATRTGILLLLASFILSTHLLGQAGGDRVKTIREEFQAINGDTALKKVTLEGDAFLDHTPDGGAALTGYYKEGQIKKIHQWIGLSHGIEVVEFYFKGGRLIFVYEQFRSFAYDPQKETLDLTRTETTFEGRYYFHNQKLFHYTTTGHNRFGDDGINPEQTLLSAAKGHRKLLNKQP